MSPVARLRFTVAAVAIAVIVAAPSAHAQVDLAWNNCLGVGNHAEVKQYACDGSLDGLYQKLVMSFVLPRTFTGFEGTLATLEFRSPSGTLPDYWRFDGHGCRPGVVSFTPTQGGIGDPVSCAYSLAGVSSTSWIGAVPVNGVGQDFIRFEAAVRVGNAPPIVLEGGRTYSAGIVLIDPVSADCAGCEQDMCIRLLSVEILYIEPGGIPPVILSGPAHRDYVSWQGPPGICAGATPVRDRTWGSVKALYR
jgi:hypothetical protein